jgi:hypothetical protein
MIDFSFIENQLHQLMNSLFSISSLTKIRSIHLPGFGNTTSHLMPFQNQHNPGNTRVLKIILQIAHPGEQTTQNIRFLAHDVYYLSPVVLFILPETIPFNKIAKNWISEMRMTDIKMMRQIEKIYSAR